jgi:hypothetical protein
MTDIELIESHIEYCTPEVRAALDRLSQGLADSERIEEIAREAENHIPYYAYGDNEAACRMADQLARVSEMLLQLRRQRS